MPVYPWRGPRGSVVGGPGAVLVHRGGLPGKIHRLNKETAGDAGGLFVSFPIYVYKFKHQRFRESQLETKNRIYIIFYISKSGITPSLTYLTIFNASPFTLSIPSGVFIQLSLFVVVSFAGQGYTLI